MDHSLRSKPILFYLLRVKSTSVNPLSILANNEFSYPQSIAKLISQDKTFSINEFNQAINQLKNETQTVPCF
jgi:hypothetical protein